MKVTVENTAPCRKQLAIEVPADRVAAEFAEIVKGFMAMAEVPGFRRGRAPRKLVERRYARQIDDEVRDRLMGRAFREALKQEKIEPVTVLDISDVSLVAGQPMTFKVVLDVPPEFTLPAYKGLALKEQAVPVGDAEVQQRLDEILDGMARTEPVADRPVRKGDLVQIDYEGDCDGHPIAGLGKDAAGLGQGKDFWMLSDEHAFLPGFDTALVGAAIGATIDVTVPFPADFRLAAVAGKTAHYRATVKAIRERRRPPLDEELLKRFGVESEPLLRDRLRAALQGEARAREKARLKDEVVRTLLDRTTLELPESMVQEETRNMFASIVRRSLSGGMTQEQVKGQREKFVEAATRSAAEKVKLGYILHRIAEEEKIEVQDAEVNAAVEQMALRYRMAPEAMRKELEEHKELDSLRHQVRMDKTLDAILGQANLA